MNDAHSQSRVEFEPYLEFLTGRRSGAIFPIGRGTCIIGREVDCHIRIESEFVSRHHCAILRDDYCIRIRDLGSKNGTLVNTSKVSLHGVLLLHGDVVILGDNQFRVHTLPSDTQEKATMFPATTRGSEDLPSTIIAGATGDTVVVAPQPADQQQIPGETPSRNSRPA